MALPTTKDQPIILYAEFLFNISQVTVYANLDLQGKIDHKAYLSSDRQRIAISYAGQTASIAYPNGVSGTATACLPLDAMASLSLRLEIVEDGIAAWQHDLKVTNDSPWSATNFGSHATVACRGCRAPIVYGYRHEKLNWKDLPRSGWSEIIDFWHCHWPGEASQHQKTPFDRALETAAQPWVDAGVAFIDTSDIILSPEDTTNVNVTETEKNKLTVVCTNCNYELGTQDRTIGGFRFHKWNITVRKSDFAPWEINEIQSLVCMQMLELMETQGTRRFIINGDTESSSIGINDLLIWIFIPDMNYCASYVSAGQPRRAMKVMYKTLSSAAPREVKDISDDSYLWLPENIASCLKFDLCKSTSLLPPEARKLHDWDVGLLDRFDKARAP